MLVLDHAYYRWQELFSFVHRSTSRSYVMVSTPTCDDFEDVGMTRIAIAFAPPGRSSPILIQTLVTLISIPPAPTSPAQTATPMELSLCSAHTTPPPATSTKAGTSIPGTFAIDIESWHADLFEVWVCGRIMGRRRRICFMHFEYQICCKGPLRSISFQLALGEGLL